MTMAIEATGLAKSYGAVNVLTDVDLSVEKGTVFALLGPNGAGKTTTVRILLHAARARTPGRPGSPGFDIIADPHGCARDQPHRPVRRGRRSRPATENLLMMGRLCHWAGDRPEAARAELLEQFDLVGRSRQGRRTYSGGMRRRLDLAATLVGDAAGDLPRRADDRARPAQPQRNVGGHRRLVDGRRRHPPHHPVPRGGRPARRRDRGGRRRPGRRRGHPRRAQATGRRRPRSS